MARLGGVFEPFSKALVRLARHKLAIGGILLAVAGGLVLWQSNGSRVVGKAVVVNHSTSTPSEAKPDKATYRWAGGPNDPKYIALPSIKTEGFIQKADVDQNNQIAVPNNIHIAAWFLKSAVPGQTGLSIIDGHVTGRVNDGIFSKLKDLKIGDTYTVEMGSGAIKKFKVISLNTVGVKDAANYLFSQDPKVSSQLNLITCAGTFNASAGGYDQRLIVGAVYQP